MNGIHTINEEEVRGGVLLLAVGEVTDDSVDVLGGGHHDIHRLELLGFAV